MPHIYQRETLSERPIRQPLRGQKTLVYTATFFFNRNKDFHNENAICVRESSIPYV